MQYTTHGKITFKKPKNNILQNNPDEMNKYYKNNTDNTNLNKDQLQNNPTHC